MIILYPCDYFNKKIPDFNYEEEFNIAKLIMDFQVLFFDYDDFIKNNSLTIFPLNHPKGICIYRGWMLKPDKYIVLYDELKKLGIDLINTPKQYEKCHIFPNVYDDIKLYTPKTIWFNNIVDIDWNLINKEFKAFMIKDFVKSVKGEDFPSKFQTAVEENYMKKYIERFVALRGELFTGGIVFKEFVNIKNEYRCFYLNGNILSISKNFNEGKDFKPVPLEFINKFKKIESNFYTIDFGELENGNWIIIETGDGQVSGLAPNEFIFGFYDRIRSILLD